jgi:glucose dehydrogenase
MEAQLDLNPKFEILSSATAPLVAESVRTSRGVEDLVYVADNHDSVYTLDADTGRVIWKRRFPNSLAVPAEATYLCPDTQS